MNLKDRVTENEKEIHKKIYLAVHSPKQLPKPGLGQGKARSQELH